jgi:DNA-binding GntR family transcriptional regulator
VSIGARFRSLPDVVADALREQIVDGNLAPGRRLVERELAEEFEVSRITLREAFQQLVGEGLVELVPRKGALVTTLTPTAVDELFDIRVALESLAARKAAERRTDADLGRLRDLLDRSDQAWEAGDQSAVAALNTEFHLAIVQIARNKMLLDMMAPVRGHLRLLFRLARQFDTTTLGTEHEALLAAITSGDAEQAASVAQRHIESTRIPTLAMIQDGQT